METHIQVNVEIEGSDKVKVISGLTITQRHDWHHTFELRVPIENLQGEKDAQNLDSSQKYIGKAIKIEFKTKSKGQSLNQFNGIITGLSLSRYSGTGSDVVFKGYSPTILLDDGPGYRSFVKSSLSKVAKDLTGKIAVNLLNTKIDISSDPQFEYLAQHNESTYNFLGRLANTWGLWFFYNGKDLIYGKMPGGSAYDIKFGHDLLSFELEEKVLPVKYKAVSHDDLKHTDYTVDSNSQKVSGLDSLAKDAMDKSEKLFTQVPTVEAREYFPDKGALEAVVKARKSAVSARMVVLSGESVAPELAVGKQIAVGAADSGDNYGNYVITSVSHFTDGMGVYQNRFEAIPAQAAIPPYNSNFHEPVAENQRGVVVDNNHPDKYGYLKVKFAWQATDEGTSKKETHWVRYLSAHAGKNRGIQFLPEVDDEVLVAFENGDPSRPYVLGSLYHGKANHSDRHDKDNLIKTIRTKSGNEIKFFDKDGEEELLIHNKDSQNMISLTLKDDGLITIKGKNKIKVEAKEINIEAEKKLTMKAEEITMGSTKKTTIESNQKLEVKAPDTKHEAAQKMAISGTQMEIKASATLDIDGGPKASLKSSGMLEVNGGGTATIKAGIVMIN